MPYKHLQFRHGMRIVLGDNKKQAAQMMLGPGETEGGPDIVCGLGDGIASIRKTARLSQGMFALSSRHQAFAGLWDLLLDLLQMPWRCALIPPTPLA